MAEQKKNWLGPYIPQGNLLREVVQQVKLAYYLMIDSRVHPLAKLIPLGAVVCLFLPTNFIPDIIPVVGQIDDAAILMIGLRLFFEVAPADVVREHLKRLSRPITDSEWNVLKKAPPEVPPAAPSDMVEGEFKLTDTPEALPEQKPGSGGPAN